MTEFDLPAASYMVSPVHTVRDTARLQAAALALEELGLSALPVVDGARRLTGLLDRSDLVRVGRLRGSRAEPRWWLPDITVAECMQSAVPVVSRSTPLRDCARRMLERGERHLFVVVDRELEGVIGTAELLRAVAGAQPAITLGEMSAEHAATVAASDPLSLAIERLAASAGRPVVVVDGESPMGIFSRTELSVCLEADGAEETRLWSDGHVLTLPASTPAHRAAQRAIQAHARYIISTHGALAHSVISSLAFASIVADLPFTLAEQQLGAAPAPAVSVAVPDYPRDFSERARAAPSSEPAQPPRSDESDARRERANPPAAAPSAPEPRSSRKHRKRTLGSRT